MGTKLFGISMITITCLYGLLAALVIPIVIITGGNVLIAILASILVLIIQFLISPWITDLVMKWFYKADFNAKLPDYLQNFLNTECQKYNIITPKIAIIDDGAPNAFTYGRTKKSARLVITRGIMELLNEEEAKVVVAHEIGHIVHLDMLFMTVAQLVPLVLYAVYQICIKAQRKTSNNDKSNGLTAIVALIAYVLYVITQYIVLWLSRTREYYADSFSIEETKNPSALAEALVKIGFGLSTNKINDNNSKLNVSKRNALGIFDSSASKAMAVASFDENGNVSKERIKNAMKWEMWNPWAKWFELHSTHPLISKRITAISEQCEKYSQTPYIIFDLKKPESYVDDFIIEAIINFLPTITAIITAIVIAMIAKTAKNNTIILTSGIGILATTFFSYIKFKKRHKNSFKETNVSELLSEVKVSNITSIPCILEGEIIGRGNPGCIFNEDFVIKDDTGIIFLDYNQPLNIANKFFALFQSEKYFNKKVRVKGWYRRSPVPYVEIYEYEVNGKNKRIWTYGLSKVIYAILAILGIAAIVISLPF